MNPENPLNQTVSVPPTLPVEPPSPHAEVAKKQKRGPHGEFIKADGSTANQSQTGIPSIVSKLTTSEDSTPPLLSFKVTNPITYLKLWWRKVMYNEGIDFRFRIHPVTAVVIVAVILGGTFSAGFIVSALRTVPVVKDFLPSPTPLPVITPTPDPNRPAAYSGVLRKGTDGRFYLQTGDGQAVNLIIPTNVSLEKYVGKRIFATGTYNTQTQFLTVTDTTDLEVLPQQAVIVPTITPSPTVQPTTTPTTQPILISSPEPTQSSNVNY